HLVSATRHLVSATRHLVSATRHLVSATRHLVSATRHLVSASGRLVSASGRLGGSLVRAARSVRVVRRRRWPWQPDPVEGREQVADDGVLVVVGVGRVGIRRGRTRVWEAG
ncbi:hypothetical protein, partial [Streptomyces sp. NPDC055099]